MANTENASGPTEPDALAEAIERVIAAEKLLSPTSRAHCGELARAVRALRAAVDQRKPTENAYD